MIVYRSSVRYMNESESESESDRRFAFCVEHHVLSE